MAAKWLYKRTQILDPGPNQQTLIRPESSSTKHHETHFFKIPFLVNFSIPLHFLDAHWLRDSRWAPLIRQCLLHQLIRSESRPVGPAILTSPEERAEFAASATNSNRSCPHSTSENPGVSGIPNTAPALTRSRAVAGGFRNLWVIGAPGYSYIVSKKSLTDLSTH